MISFDNSKTYSWIALISILLGDVFAVIARFNEQSIWYYILAGVFSFLVLLWIIGFIKDVGLGFKNTILAKLLSNAAGARTLSNIYILLFVVHIGWLGNIPSSSDSILLSLFVCITLILFLILFFPNSKERKCDNATKIFVSGISQINFANLNMLPLVRILQLTNEDNTTEMIIINSNYYNKFYSTEKDDKDKNKIINNINSYFNEYYDRAYMKLNDPDIKKNFDDIKSGGDVIEKLKLIIRIFAYCEFPEKIWLLDPNKFLINFTAAQNYDDFQECFDAIEKQLSGKDNPSNVLFFNLTPGTANISALMTLMAIDGDRKLYYFVPENDPNKVRAMTEKEKQLRLTEVKKKDIPLDNLLSQAIETLN